MLVNSIKGNHREKPPSNKTLKYTKSANKAVSVVGTTNQLFIRGSEAETKFSKKKQLLAKLRSL